MSVSKHVNVTYKGERLTGWKAALAATLVIVAWSVAMAIIAFLTIVPWLVGLAYMGRYIFGMN